MTKEECQLALQRHATSKISQLEDLYNIQTLGFRGEALPSIASVSQLTIEPNPSGSGITVTVKDLFYNTPARKKFLKAPATEMGHLGNVVTKYAIANPQIAFELISDGKPLFKSAGSGNLKDVLVSIYGVELAKNLLAVKAETGKIKINGLVSRPTVSRLDREYETFIVNGRYIKNFLLNRALGEAYRTLIPNNRYPVAVLFIEIDPRVIDVNVHPTKKEIKFARTQEVMDAVREAVKVALEPDKVNEPNFTPEPNDWFAAPNSFDQLLMTPNYSADANQQPLPIQPVQQLNNTYIICADQDELVLIDQHAAHERILYDRLAQKSVAQEQQTLLIPETLELAPTEALVLGDSLDYLNELGFNLEVFGHNSFIVRAVPAVASKQPARQLLTDLIADLVNLGKSSQVAIKEENIRKLVACHSAIKAGDPLTPLEINQLLKDLYQTENPATCPHGRPTMVRFPLSEINKRFGR
jgi:DNA mismatch repair protein MutL